MGDVNRLLNRIANGDAEAIDGLVALLYDDLRRMARSRLRANGPNTLLDTTSLAHEAYLRLRGAGRIDVDSRGRFLAYCSQVLRAVIVDFARRRGAERRGGDQPHLTLSTDVEGSVVGDGGDDIERVNDALLELERSDPRLKQVVEMRYFGGLTEAEIAEALGLTERTVRRDWERARLLLSVGLKR